MSAAESFFEIANAALAPSELHHGMLAERMGPQGQPEHHWPQWLGEIKAQVDEIARSPAWTELLKQSGPTNANTLNALLKLIDLRTYGFEAIYENPADLRSIHWLRFAHAIVDFAHKFVTMLDGTNWWLKGVEVSPAHREAFAKPYNALKGLELQNLLALLKPLHDLDRLTTLAALHKDLDTVVAEHTAQPLRKSFWEAIEPLLEESELESALRKVRELFSDAYWQSMIQTPLESFAREENASPPAAVRDAGAAR